MDIKCFRCGRRPDDISEYVTYGQAEGLTPTEFVIQLEGTFNRANGHFACTECYLAIGMPTSINGWHAP